MFTHTCDRRRAGSCVTLDTVPSTPAPQPPLRASTRPCPSGSHSPGTTEGKGRGGKIMAHGINLGVVCIFIALASDSSLQKGFKKD